MEAIEDEDHYLVSTDRQREKFRRRENIQSRPNCLSRIPGSFHLQKSNPKSTDW